MDNYITVDYLIASRGNGETPVLVLLHLVFGICNKQSLIE